MKKPLKNKKALSSIVIMVITIALVIAIMGIVFNLTKKTVEKEIEKTDSCGINIIDKININSEYVCYDSSNSKVIVSIERKDIDLDNLLIIIKTESQITKYKLNDTEIIRQGVLNFPYTNINQKTSLPSKNGGKTYILEVPEPPYQIQIAPIINKKQCNEIDSIDNIVDCSQTTILN